MNADTTLAPCPTEPDTKEFTALGQFLMSCSDVRMDGGKMIEAMAYLVARAQAPAPQGPTAQYRLLQADIDTIEATDEFLSGDATTWAIDPGGVFVGMPYAARVLRPARRAIKGDA